MFKIIGILSILLICGVAAKYPSDLPKCRYGDTDCIQNAIAKILPLAANGLSSLNLVPLNPITIDKIELLQDGNGPVTLKTTLTDVKIYGIDTFHVKKIVGFGQDIEQSKYEIHGVMARMNVVGDYSMKGRILVLPITGDGVLNWTIHDSAVSVKLQPTVLEKNGKKYLQFKKIIYKAQPSNAMIHLTNLFGGDEALGRTMNDFLNQNWREIYNEMEGVIGDAIGKILIGLLNNVFNKHEYNDLFIAE